MDKRHSRYVGPVGDDQVGQVSWRSGHRPRSSRSVRGRFTVEVLRILAVLGLGLVPTDKARAQAPPAKAEAPPEASTEALSARYRFTEKYSLNEDPQKPEFVSQYQVALRATYKTVTEKPQGAPDQSETSSQMIYTERPAKVGRIGEVTDAVRRYDRFLMKSMTPTRPPKPPWFEGLIVWYRHREGQEPEILSLTTDRPLREVEFEAISRQVFLPQLTILFSPTPLRVGDNWHIPIRSARYLVGDTPDPEDYVMDGTLIEVRKGASGTALTAVIGITGQFTVPDGQSALNARIHFVFEPSAAGSAPVRKGTSPTSAGGKAKNSETTINAKGWVSHVALVQTFLNPIPDTDGRLKVTTDYHLSLERRRLPSAPNAAGGVKDAPLSVPDPAPTANENNSWLVYDDPKGQFHFRHPQELRIEPRLTDPNVVELVDRHLRGSALIFQFVPKEANPERERQYRDPDYHRRTLHALWEKQHWDVVAGPTGWLPEADWLPLKRKVYRIEAATKPPGAGDNIQRQYHDYHLVLFTTNRAIVVWAITTEDHLKFRDQAEAVIKSFQFGPSEGQPKSPTATQTPALTPPP